MAVVGAGASLAGRSPCVSGEGCVRGGLCPIFHPLLFPLKKGELTLLSAVDLSMVTTGFQKPEQRFGSMENNNFSKFPPNAMPGMPIAALGHVPACIRLPRSWLFSRLSPPGKPNGLCQPRASPGGTCNPSHPHREPGGASCHIPEGAKASRRGRWGPALPSRRGAAALSIPASCRQREPARHHPCAVAADGCNIFLEGPGESDGDVLMLSVPVRSLLMGREQPAGCQHATSALLVVEAAPPSAQRCHTAAECPQPMAPARLTNRTPGPASLPQAPQGHRVPQRVLLPAPLSPPVSSALCLGLCCYFGASSVVAAWPLCSGLPEPLGSVNS